MTSSIFFGCVPQVKMLHLVATDFRQSLNQTMVCSRSDAANPNHFHKTEETVLTNPSLFSAHAVMLIFNFFEGKESLL